MSATNTEWATDTNNSQRGCSKVGAGCKNCYALPLVYRQQFNPKLPDDVRNASRLATRKTADGKLVWTGKIIPVPSQFDQLGPLRDVKKPRRIFVGSLTDLFHENADLEYTNRVFGRMANAPQHQFIVATKRPERALQYCQEYGLMAPHPSGETWPDNVIPLVSIWDQKSADEFIPLLLQIPSLLHGVSVEPMLGPVDLREWIGTHNCYICYARFFVGDCPEGEHDEDGKYVCPECGSDEGVGTWDSWMGREYEGPGFDWCICGGESGPGARPMHPDWARSLRDQCDEADVAFLFKQWGEWSPGRQAPGLSDQEMSTKPCQQLDYAGCSVGTFRVGKKAAGRILDGKLHDQYPEARP